jgi:catechol 2,3-dioxygenase-like lactoylglutathione lyase family enzyme
MKEFGAGDGSRHNSPAAMFTIGEVDFLKAGGGGRGPAPATPPAPPAGTQGRALDHIGFDVADIDTAFKRFADDGVTINSPARDMTKQVGLHFGFITDPNGAYIEVTQGLKDLNGK